MSGDLPRGSCIKRTEAPRDQDTPQPIPGEAGLSFLILGLEARTRAFMDSATEDWVGFQEVLIVMSGDFCPFRYSEYRNWGA